MTASTDTDSTKSEIQNFYNGKTIFITGASGFLGKLIVEKLLRSCVNLKHIYILLRQKKDKSPQERLKEIFDIPAFEPLKSSQPNFSSKVSMFEGDLILPYLGLSDSNISTIKNEVNCIIHAGATVRFDEKLKKATYINVRGTRDLIRLAKEVMNLESFVHVSTAYSNCSRSNIDETFYDPIIKGDKLLELVECFDDNLLDEITPKILQENPNTYVFTKAIAEDIIRRESGDLPMAIVRPSIVISTCHEPVPGWLDNIYGPTSILLGGALGLLRTLHGRGSNVADLVPADFVINAIIAAGWDAAENNKNGTKNGDQEKQQREEPKIFNYVSRPQNPITWNEYKDMSKEYGIKIPSPLIVWHATFDFHANYYISWIISLLCQTIPAYVVDFLARCIGKKTMFVQSFKRIDKFCDVISYFTMRQWQFQNGNVQSLWHRLNKIDKEMYNFDMMNMTWNEFFSTYLLGARIYLLKDPLDTLPAGRRKLLAVKIGHYLLVTMLCLLFYTFLMLIWNLF